MTRRITVPALREFATVANDITYPAASGVFYNPDPTLHSRAGGRGLKLYDDVERDAHAFAVLQKRKLAVIARPWDVKPGGTRAVDKRAAEETRKLLNRIPFDRITLDMLDSLLKGFSVGEAMWVKQNGLLDIVDVLPREQIRFNFDKDYKLCLKTPENMQPGQVMPDRKFVVCTFGGKNGNPYGRGLGHVLWFLVYFKKEAFKYWLSGAEKFGTPTVVASVPGATPEAEQDKALSVAESVSSETAVVKPDTMVLELLESKRANDTTMWEHLIKLFNSEISKAGQGNDATTEQSTHGSRASVGAFYAMERVLTKADADLVCDTINRTLVKWFVEVNFPGAELPRVYRNMDEPKDLTEQAKHDTLVGALGFTPSLDYIRETYGGHWDKAAPPPAPEAAPGEEPIDPGVKGQVEAAKSPNAPAGQ